MRWYLKSSNLLGWIQVMPCLLQSGFTKPIPVGPVPKDSIVPTARNSRNMGPPPNRLSTGVDSSSFGSDQNPVPGGLSRPTSLPNYEQANNFRVSQRSDLPNRPDGLLAGVTILESHSGADRQPVLYTYSDASPLMTSRGDDPSRNPGNRINGPTLASNSHHRTGSLRTRTRLANYPSYNPMTSEELIHEELAQKCDYEWGDFLERVRTNPPLARDSPPMTHAHAPRIQMMYHNSAANMNHHPGVGPSNLGERPSTSGSKKKNEDGESEWWNEMDPEVEKFLLSSSKH